MRKFFVVLVGVFSTALCGCTSSSRGDLQRVVIEPMPAQVSKPLPYGPTAYVPAPVYAPAPSVVAAPTVVPVQQPMVVYQQPVVYQQAPQYYVRQTDLGGGLVYTQTWEPYYYQPSTVYYNTTRTWVVGGSWTFGGFGDHDGHHHEERRVAPPVHTERPVQRQQTQSQGQGQHR